MEVENATASGSPSSGVPMNGHTAPHGMGSSENHNDTKDTPNGTSAPTPPDAGLATTKTETDDANAGPTQTTSATTTATTATRKRKTAMKKEAEERERAEKKRKKEEQAAASKEAKAAEKEAKAAEKEAKAAEKEALKRKKEEEQARKKKAQPSVLAYMRKKDPEAGPSIAATSPKGPQPSSVVDSGIKVGSTAGTDTTNTEDSKSLKTAWDRFRPFFVKENVKVAPILTFEITDETKEVKSRVLDEWISQEPEVFNPIPFNPVETFQLACAHSSRGRVPPNVRAIITQLHGLTGKELDSQLGLVREQLEKVPMKILKFHQDLRPPYVGTITSASAAELHKLSRRPCGRLLPKIDYDYDSEAEWEEGQDEGLAEDIDISDADDENEGDDDVQDFIDDSDHVVISRLRPTFLDGVKPVSSGLYFEGETKFDPSAEVHKYRLEVLPPKLIKERPEHNDPPIQTTGFDPFSDQYWISDTDWTSRSPLPHSLPHPSSYRRLQGQAQPGIRPPIHSVSLQVPTQHRSQQLHMSTANNNTTNDPVPSMSGNNMNPPPPPPITIKVGDQLVPVAYRYPEGNGWMARKSPSELPTTRVPFPPGRYIPDSIRAEFEKAIVSDESNFLTINALCQVLGHRFRDSRITKMDINNSVQFLATRLNLEGRGKKDARWYLKDPPFIDPPQIPPR